MSMSERDAAADRAYLNADRDTPLDELPDHIHRLWVTAEYWIGEAERLRGENATLRARVAELEAERYYDGDCRECNGDGKLCSECGYDVARCDCVVETTFITCGDCGGTGVEQER